MQVNWLSCGLMIEVMELFMVGKTLLPEAAFHAYQ